MSQLDATMSPPAPAQSHADLPQPVIFLLFAVVVLLLHITFWQTMSRPTDHALIGPDSYMRLVRVEQLLRTGDWRADTIARSNAPYGEVQHWTRPFDVVLIALSGVLRPFIDAPDSLYWAGVVVSPLLHVLLCLVGAWAATPLLGQRSRLWMMPVLLAQWPIIAYVVPGRADHHGFIFLFFLLGAGAMLRLLARPASRWWPIAAGAVHGFGLWITVVEFVVLLAIATLILSLRWALTRDGRAVTDHARQALLFAVTAAAVTGIAVALDGPGAGVLTPAYDRISIVHLALAGVVAVAWMMLAVIGRRERTAGSAAWRVALLAAIGLCAIAVMATLYPLFFLGPMAGVDPRVDAILSNTILEMQPLVPDTPGRLALFLRHMGAGLIGVPMLIWALGSPGESERRWLWTYLAIGLSVTTALALAYFRFSPLFALLIAFPLAAFIGITFEAIGTRLEAIAGTLARSVSVLVILMSPVMLEVASKSLFAHPGSGALVAANCPSDDITPLLNAADGAFAQPRIILSNSLALAATILYRTPHAVVATPYFGAMPESW